MPLQLANAAMRRIQTHERAMNRTRHTYLNRFESEETARINRATKGKTRYPVYLSLSGFGHFPFGREKKTRTKKKKPENITEY